MGLHTNKQNNRLVNIKDLFIPTLLCYTSCNVFRAFKLKDEEGEDLKDSGIE